MARAGCNPFQLIPTTESSRHLAVCADSAAVARGHRPRCRHFSSRTAHLRPARCDRWTGSLGSALHPAGPSHCNPDRCGTRRRVRPQHAHQSARNSSAHPRQVRGVLQSQPGRGRPRLPKVGSHGDLGKYGREDARVSRHHTPTSRLPTAQPRNRLGGAPVRPVSTFRALVPTQRRQRLD